MRRIGEAEATAIGIDRIIRLVPRPDGRRGLWLTPTSCCRTFGIRREAKGRRWKRMDPRAVSPTYRGSGPRDLRSVNAQQAWMKRDAAKTAGAEPTGERCRG